MAPMQRTTFRVIVHHHSSLKNVVPSMVFDCRSTRMAANGIALLRYRLEEPGTNMQTRIDMHAASDNLSRLRA